jgi:hypothetical protein
MNPDVFFQKTLGFSLWNSWYATSLAIVGIHKTTMKKLLAIAALVAGAVAVQAQQTSQGGSMDTSAFQLSLTPDIAIHPRTTEIDGFSLGIWSENPQKSFTLGFVNGSTGDSKGFSVGLVNYDESYTGVQWGLVNYSTGNFKGWQDGWVNISQGTFAGFQHGIVNVADEFHGFQLGWINYSENLNGLQIGLVNVAMNNGWFDEFPDKLAKGFVIVNWSF